MNRHTVSSYCLSQGKARVSERHNTLVDVNALFEHHLALYWAKHTDITPYFEVKRKGSGVKRKGSGVNNLSARNAPV